MDLDDTTVIDGDPPALARCSMRSGGPHRSTCRWCWCCRAGRHPVRRAIESAGLRFVSRPDLPAALAAVRRRARLRRRAGTAPCSAVPD